MKLPPKVPADTALLLDPGIQNFEKMRNSTHFYFTINRRRFVPLFILVVAVPGSIFFLTLKSFVKSYNFRRTRIDCMDGVVKFLEKA